jgi:uncharacterized phiE125 gp8 family phage protein
MTYRPRSRVFTPAALSVSAVNLAEMKMHLRVDDTSEDTLIAAISIAATAAVESWTHRLLIQRQAVLNLPGLPIGLEPVELPGGAVASVASVVAAGTTVTGAAVYGNSPALLVPATDWPVVTAEGYPVTITYTAGFTAVPEDLKAAVKLIAADLFEQRGQSTAQSVNVVAISAEWLMARHRIQAI